MLAGSDDYLLNADDELIELGPCRGAKSKCHAGCCAEE